uniref:hypothetical protein n=1 Tax=Komagataeibacter xylinus TaxID=28448 RepID=UPI0019552861
VLFKNFRIGLLCNNKFRYVLITSTIMRFHIKQNGHATNISYFGPIASGQKTRNFLAGASIFETGDTYEDGNGQWLLSCGPYE